MKEFMKKFQDKISKFESRPFLLSVIFIMIGIVAILRYRNGFHNGIASIFEALFCLMTIFFCFIASLCSFLYGISSKTSKQKKIKMPTHFMLLIGLPILFFIIALCFIGNTSEAFDCSCYFSSVVWSCWLFIIAIRRPIISLIGIFILFLLYLIYGKSSQLNFGLFEIIRYGIFGHGLKSAIVLFLILIGIDTSDWIYCSFKKGHLKNNKKN